jgi:uncharacterized protein (DUF58 family)
MLFDEATLRKINQLSLVATRIRAGVMKGERRSSKRGTSIEFADYRDYTAGDDLRRLDWNVYARLDRPFIKLLEEEEDLAVHVLVDTSKSMDWGEAKAHKLRYALCLAGALGAIALSAGDRLTLATLHLGGPPQQFGPVRGSQHLMRMLAFLENLLDGKNAVLPPLATNLDRSLRDYALESRRPGMAFVISDLFSPAGYQDGISHLLGRAYDVTILHVLAEDEIDPPLAGDLRLVDSETEQAQEVSIDGGMRLAYRQRLLTWREEIRHSCQQRGVRYMDLSTATDWDKVVLYEMRRGGYVK